MANKKLSTSYRKLKFKYEYLTLEWEETEGELGDRIDVFREAYQEYYDLLSDEEKQRIDSVQERVHVEDQLTQGIPEPKTQRQELKKIYKEIAKETHPDKFVLRSKKVQEEKKALFQKASEHYENEDLIGLERVAMELGIEIGPPTEGHIEVVEDQIIRMATQVKKARTSRAWNYSELDNDADRLSAMREYFGIILGASI